MKLGLKYFETGYGSSNLPPINGGAWDSASNFPADLGKIFACASIPEEDGVTLVYSYKYIPEGMLIMIAKRISIRGRVTHGFQALWIFVPEGTDISAANLIELMKLTSDLFKNSLIFANAEKFETATKPLFSSEWGTSDNSIVGKGNMHGTELAIVNCVPPMTLESLLAKGFIKIYDSYGLIVVNETGSNNTDVPIIDPFSLNQSSPKNETEIPQQKKVVESINPLIPPPIPGISPKTPVSSIAPDPVSPQPFLEENQHKVTENTVQEGVLYEPTIQKKSKTPLIFSIIVVLLLMAGGIFGWFYYDTIYLPEKIDREAPRKFPIVNVFLRSSKMAGADFNKIISVPAESELIAYEDDGEWTKVKYIPNNDKSNPIEGYMASAYLIDRDDVYLLNSIFGDNDSKEELSTSKVRKGLLEYYRENDISGKINQELAQELGIYTSPYDQWQVFSRNGNEILYKRAYNSSSKFTDLAVIIENVYTGERKLLYFTYDEDETPHVRLATNYYGDSIKDYDVYGSYLYVTDRYGNSTYYNIDCSIN